MMFSPLLNSDYRRLAITLAGAVFGLASLAPQIVPAAEPATNVGNPLTVPQTKLFPAGTHLPPEDPTAKQYENNPRALAEGRQLYTAYNCSGCHFYGAGGMGPPFMNGGHWLFGGRLDQIYASIYEGRAEGMPAWGHKIPPEQIWELAAFVKSLSLPAQLHTTGGPEVPKSRQTKTPFPSQSVQPPGLK